MSSRATPLMARRRWPATPGSEVAWQRAAAELSRLRTVADDRDSSINATQARGVVSVREVREIAPTHALTEAHWRTQEIADDLRAALEQIADVLGDLQARVPDQE